MSPSLRQRALAGVFVSLAVLVTACSSGKHSSADSPPSNRAGTASPSVGATRGGEPAPEFRDARFALEGAPGKDCYHSVVDFDGRGPVVHNHADSWGMMDHHDLDIHSCPDGVTLTIAWGGRKVTGKVGMRACEQAVSGVNGAGPGVNGVEGIVNEMPISSIRPGDQFCEFNGASATVRLFRLLSVNHSTSETTWTATTWSDLGYSG